MPSCWGECGTRLSSTSSMAVGRTGERAHGPLRSSTLSQCHLSPWSRSGRVRCSRGPASARPRAEEYHLTKARMLLTLSNGQMIKCQRMRLDEFTESCPCDDCKSQGQQLSFDDLTA